MHIHHQPCVGANLPAKASDQTPQLSKPSRSLTTETHISATCEK
jgi:hypothetical protein